MTREQIFLKQIQRVPVTEPLIVTRDEGMGDFTYVGLRCPYLSMDKVKLDLYYKPSHTKETVKLKMDEARQLVDEKGSSYKVYMPDEEHMDTIWKWLSEFEGVIEELLGESK